MHRESDPEGDACSREIAEVSMITGWQWSVQNYLRINRWSQKDARFVGHSKCCTEPVTYEIVGGCKLSVSSRRDCHGVPTRVEDETKPSTHRNRRDSVALTGAT